MQSSTPHLRYAALRLRPFFAKSLLAAGLALEIPQPLRFGHVEPAIVRLPVVDCRFRHPRVGEDSVIERHRQVIGKAGLYRFPEVGFILHPDAWGHGYAQEALRPVLERALSVHRLPDVDPDNAASFRVLTRLGFKAVGRARLTWNVGGQWRDSVCLRLESMSAR